MKRHTITTVAILLSGCVGALVIYVSAGTPPENPFEEFEHSKRFTRSVEVMGGKMSLVANDMSKWFSSLWQGEQLAFTVVIITVVITAAYYLIASGTMTKGKTGEASVRTSSVDQQADPEPHTIKL